MRRAVLRDINAPTPPAVRPVDRIPAPELSAAPTDAELHAWATAALSSMARIGGMPQRRSSVPWWLVGAAVVVAWGAVALAAITRSAPEPVRHELRIPQ